MYVLNILSTPRDFQLPVDSIESTVSSSLPFTMSDTFLPEQRLPTLSTSFTQRFQNYTVTITQFGITIVSGTFALIYSILRYFFGDVHPIFLLENLQDFLLPPFIPRYNISSLELRYAETYSTAGILQRLYGDYSRAYSTQLFCVFMIHLYITLHNSIEIGACSFNFGYHNIAYLPTNFIVSYAYAMLFLAYLPFAHRYLTQAYLHKGYIIFIDTSKLLNHSYNSIFLNLLLNQQERSSWRQLHAELFLQIHHMNSRIHLIILFHHLYLRLLLILQCNNHYYDMIDSSM